MINPTQADIDQRRKVIYRRPHCRVEEGIITSFNAKYVFVSYGGQTTSQATERNDLTWLFGGDQDDAQPH